jgi:hypothetical protein
MHETKTHLTQQGPFLRAAQQAGACPALMQRVVQARERRRRRSVGCRLQRGLHPAHILGRHRLQLFGRLRHGKRGTAQRASGNLQQPAR